MSKARHQPVRRAYRQAYLRMRGCINIGLAVTLGEDFNQLEVTVYQWLLNRCRSSDVLQERCSSFTPNSYWRTRVYPLLKK
jgi:uncharacterized protein YgiB involved in biofilm formation